jgi:hypothetical protein
MHELSAPDGLLSVAFGFLKTPVRFAVEEYGHHLRNKCSQTPACPHMLLGAGPLVPRLSGSVAAVRPGHRPRHSGGTIRQVRCNATVSPPAGVWTAQNDEIADPMQGCLNLLSEALHTVRNRTRQNATLFRALTWRYG